MPSVKETLEAAKNAAKAAVQKALQTNAEKIAELTNEFEKIQTRIGKNIVAKKDMETELKSGDVPEAATTIVQKNIHNMRKEIDEKISDAEKVLGKLEKLGAKDLAQAKRQEMSNLVHISNAKRGVSL
jgi:chaperonin cofactor prefoldin